MLIIGSLAMKHHGFNVEPNDIDYICTFEEFQGWCRDFKEIIRSCVPLDGSHFHVVIQSGKNMEFEIAWPGSSGDILLDRYGRKDGRTVHAPLEVLYALKMSHRYKKNSPHFLKTMRDIQFLRNHITRKDEQLSYSEWFKQREAETYVYNHPKLDVSKQEFFAGDGVQYVYDHDSIHKTVALLPDNLPAYTRYMREGSEVMTSKEKFMAQRWEIQLYGVYEETCVLALERSQIPYGKVHWGPIKSLEGGPTPRWSFEKALEKVCTSITSGWFREYAWENYDKVLALYAEMGENNYIERFQANAQYLKPFKE